MPFLLRPHECPLAIFTLELDFGTVPYQMRFHRFSAYKQLLRTAVEDALTLVHKVSFQMLFSVGMLENLTAVGACELEPRKGTYHVSVHAMWLVNLATVGAILMVLEPRTDAWSAEEHVAL